MTQHLSLYVNILVQIGFKDICLYAFAMKPDHRKEAVTTSLKPEEKISRVDFLGHGPIEFAQHSGILIADLPEGRDSRFPGVLKIYL